MTDDEARERTCASCADWLERIDMGALRASLSRLISSSDADAAVRHLEDMREYDRATRRIIRASRRAGQQSD